MEFLHQAIDFFLHLDRHLGGIIQSYGSWTYGILFLIVFCETGLVIAPFLPGDSLLFAAGTFAAAGALDVRTLAGLLFIAAVAGDNLNYWIGHHVGPALFRHEESRFLNRKHLDRTHQFYERHGVKTIIIARFMPILRTFAPFVAGLGRMNYLRFFVYDLIGGALWISTFVFMGYGFGNLPFVKKNFSLAILIIILFSVLPGVVEYVRHKRAESRPR